MPAVIRIPRPAPTEYAKPFARYVDRVQGDDAIEALATQIEDTTRLLRGVDESRGGYRYAPGKWSIKETITHMTDAERVFSYRALHFARQDGVALPPFDENEWASRYRSDARPLTELIDELRAVRASTLALFHGLDSDELAHVGVANQNPMTARGAAWTIAGHELHHVNVLRERYGLGARA